MFLFGCETTSDEASSTLGQVEVLEVVVEETVEIQKEIVQEPVAPVKVETPQEIFDRRQEESLKKFYDALYEPEYRLNYSDRGRIWFNVRGPESSDEEIMKNRKLAEPLVTEKKNITGKIVNPTDEDIELGLRVRIESVFDGNMCNEYNVITIPAKSEYYVIIENGLDKLIDFFGLSKCLDEADFGETFYWIFTEDQFYVGNLEKNPIPNLLYNPENFSYISEIFKTHSFEASCIKGSDINLIVPLDENEIRNYDNLLIIKAN
jgi:hypothetical protein